MAFLRLIAILLALGLAEARAAAASAAEKQAFGVAAESFRGKWWDRAEKEFGDFVKLFPDSERKPEAVLYQAEARFNLKLFTGVIDLLDANLSKAGRWADEYNFWLGQAWFQSGNYQKALDAFAIVVNKFPGSTNCLEASIGEAAARFNLKDWVGVRDSLSQTNGVFQLAAKATPNNEFVVRGQLLLSEALLALKSFPAAEETVQRLASQKLKPDLDWRRQFLLCRIQLAANRPLDALPGATNLVEIAKNPDARAFAPQSVALLAQLKEALARYDEAIAVYEQNLTPETPADLRRQALSKVVELSLAQNLVTNTIGRLEKFVAQSPNDAVADLALLTLGELRLKEFASGQAGKAAADPAPLSPVATNLLKQAEAHFDRLVTVFTNSEYYGKAQLDRGWCYWAERKFPESRTAFQLAVEKLPAGYDQAVARFKLGDALYELKDVAAAVTNYNLVLEQYAAVLQVQTNLIEPVLYQLLQVNLQLNNLSGATNALGRILADYPGSFYLDRGMLLVGQVLTRQGDPAHARELFSKLPQSTLQPQLQLAIARTYQQERDWKNAIEKYDAWIPTYTNNESLPSAEYSRAWANYQAGNETNALIQFTSFAARFPTNDLAPLAQYWVADHYFNSGDYINAEKNAQLLFQKWPPSELTYRARMLAGKAAFARLGYLDARKYFADLINVLDKATNNPPELMAEAYLKLGDTIFEQFVADPAKPSVKFKEAQTAYNQAMVVAPNSRFAPLALGQIGTRYYQLGGDDPKRYDLAAEAFQQVVTNAFAETAARSEAEMGLAMVLEKQAALKPEAEQTQWLQRALDHYLNIIYGKNLKPGGQSDLHWIEKAGLAAGNLAESLKQWEQAASLYQTLAEKLPPLRTVLEARASKAREHVPPAKK